MTGLPEPPGVDDTAADAWPGDWLRGVLGLCVLHALAEGPTYGYALVVRLAAGGLGTIKGGTLYPLLSRLEQTGLVDVEWRAGEGGPGRKYYALTDAGRSVLATGAHDWARFAEVTTRFMRDAGTTAARGTTTTMTTTEENS